MSHQVLLWAGFSLFIIAMLALDLGVLHRRAHVVHVHEALRWSGIWVGLALCFAVGVYLWSGTDTALAFLTGYILEESLSIDNLFVILLILSYFKVPAIYQHKVLFWGILGALVMRAVMILVGAALIQTFHWIIYLFGGFLVFTGIKMALQKHEDVHPEKNPVIRLFTRFMPVTTSYHGDKFFIFHESRRYATPLFLVVLMVEATDLVFAVDSIPAVLAITQDPFIVYTSNVFAILGLRSLFFALAGLMGLFHYLRFGLSVVLVFIGLKMVCERMIHVPIPLALGVVAGVLLLAIVASLLWPQEVRAIETSPDLSSEGA